MKLELSHEQEIDLRDAAFNMAALTVVGHATGLNSVVIIRIVQEERPEPGNRTIIGNAQLHGKMPPITASIIAWAGVLAGEIQADSSMADDEIMDQPVRPNQKCLELLNSVSPALRETARWNALREVRANWEEIEKLADVLISAYREGGEVHHSVIPPRILQEALTADGHSTLPIPVMVMARSE